MKSKISNVKVAELLKMAKNKIVRDCDFLAIEVLLAFVLEHDRTYLIAHADEYLTIVQKRRFDKLFARLLKGEPLAFLTGKKEFFGLDFIVNKNVLIPRPETELLVGKTLEYIENIYMQKSHNACQNGHQNSPQNIEQKNDTSGGAGGAQSSSRFKALDIGTGSGCIAVSIAKTMPDIFVIGIDISSKALRIARKNAKKHSVDERVRFLKSDLLANINERFDIIVVNLPYIGRRRFNFVDVNVLAYEPEIALFGGDDGLALYEKLFQQLNGKTWKPSALLGEFGFLQREELEKLLKKYFPKEHITFFQDYAGIDRVFMIEFYRYVPQTAKNGG